MRSRSVVRVVASMLTPALSACTPDHSSVGLSVRDSGGVQIVENHGRAWTNETAWTLDSVPLIDVGGGADPSLQLFRVLEVIGLGRRIAVLHASSSEVLLFDSVGQLVRRVGRRGSGPEEFASLQAMYRCGADTLAVNDATRISFFDADGAFIRTQPIAAGRGDEFPRVRGVASNCSAFLMSGAYTPGPVRGEIGRRSSALFWSGLDRTRRDTIAIFPGQELAGRTIQGLDQALYLPWGVDGVWAINGDRFFWGSSNEAEIRRYVRGTGLTQILRWQPARQAVSAEDRRLYNEKREWLLERFAQGKEMVPPLSEFPSVSTHKPLFRSFLVDEEENLWVRRYPDFIAGRPDLYDLAVPLRYSPPPGQEREVYTVFDSTGRWLGEVNVPPQFVIRSIHRNRVMGVWKDAFDVEHVRVYRLLKPGT